MPGIGPGDALCRARLVDAGKPVAAEESAAMRPEWLSCQRRTAGLLAPS